MPQKCTQSSTGGLFLARRLPAQCVVLFARPGVGALTLALLYGLFALTYGATQIAAGSQWRSVGRKVGAALHRAA